MQGKDGQPGFASVRLADVFQREGRGQEAHMRIRTQQPLHRGLVVGGVRQVGQHHPHASRKARWGHQIAGLDDHR